MMEVVGGHNLILIVYRVLNTNIRNVVYRIVLISMIWESKSVILIVVIKLPGKLSIFLSIRNFVII